MKKRLIKFSLMLLISMSVYGILGHADLIKNRIFASTISNYSEINNSVIYNFKIITGEDLINVQEGPNVYKANIANNKNLVSLQFDCENSFDPSDFVVISSDNTIVGNILKDEPLLVVNNLKEGLNIIKIKNKLDNSELYKFYINYKNVKVSGLKSEIKAGDIFKLEAKIDEKVYKNIKWTSIGIDSVIVSDNGEVTVLNNGIGRILGTIYNGDWKNVVGSVNVEFNVIGKSQLGWILNGGKWYYIDNLTRTFKIGWLYENGEWYYIKDDGSMKIGWLYKDGLWYYLKENGSMAIEWIKENGKWYFFDEDGAMKVGWIQSHGNWYYLNSDGTMETKSKIIDGKFYKFELNGKLK